MFKTGPVDYLETSSVSRSGAALRFQSLTAVEINLIALGHPLSRASGFFVRLLDQLWLVSNFHVFSGRHAETDRCLSGSLAKPTEIKIRFLPTQSEKEEIKIFNYDVFTYSLYDHNKPLWYMHQLGSEIDVGALHIASAKSIKDARPFAIDRSNGDTRVLINRAMRGLRPGSEVFVVGYPDNFETEGMLPIWKRGTIASEPLVIGDNARPLLIDCATRSGLSGSPVYVRHTDDGKSFLLPIGVYASRKPRSDKFDSEVGTVFPFPFIENVLVSGVKPLSFYENEEDDVHP